MDEINRKRIKKNILDVPQAKGLSRDDVFDALKEICRIAQEDEAKDLQFIGIVRIIDTKRADGIGDEYHGMRFGIRDLCDALGLIEFMKYWEIEKDYEAVAEPPKGS